MRTVKFLITGLALAFGIMTAQAQNTPEAIIGQCPSVPSISTILASHANPPSEAAIRAINEFNAKLRDLDEKNRQASQEGVATAAMSDGERLAQQQTGKSIDQLKNMSEGDISGLVNSQLANLGRGNTSLSDLRALDGKNTEQIMAAMGNKAVATSGLTAQEIAAMENMTEKEQEAYMKQGDRMQRVQAANAQGARGQSASVSQTDIVAGIKTINDRWQEIDALNKKETEEVARQIIAIKDRYAPQFAAIPRTEGSHEMIYTEANEKALHNLQAACDSECFTLWHNLISKIQGRLKTKLADVPRFDELTAQQAAAGGMTATAKVMPSAGYAIAGEYLSITQSATSYPWVSND